MIPIVAIVGRPNVGKSSLLNRVAGEMISIVDSAPGITRDRISTLCHHNGRYFELVDTGGYGIEDVDDLTVEVEQQITYAIEQAAVILFVVDAREGVVALDRRVADLLRRLGVEDRVLLLANKVDAPGKDAALSADFFSLGLGDPTAISAMHGRGVPQVLDEVAERLERAGLGDAEQAGPEADEPEMKIALVGKRNAGKSTFINAIAGGPRVIVSEVPGTTRDSVDVRFVKDGRSFVAIDTAGVRKRRAVKKDVDFYSLTRAERSIRRADVVLLLIDATVPVSSVDKKLGHHIVDQHKPVILVVNKFDLVKHQADSGDYANYLDEVLPGLDYAPIAVTTATEGKNLQSVLDLAATLFKQASTRLGTGRLNALVEQIKDNQPPGLTPAKYGRVKIFYATQVSVRPPTIVLFVNDPQRVTAAYERFLLNRIRELTPFEEVPIRLLLRARGERDEHGQKVPWKKQKLRGGRPKGKPDPKSPPKVKRAQKAPPKSKGRGSGPGGKGGKGKPRGRSGRSR